MGVVIPARVRRQSGRCRCHGVGSGREPARRAVRIVATPCLQLPPTGQVQVVVSWVRPPLVDHRTHTTYDVRPDPRQRALMAPSSVLSTISSALKPARMPRILSREQEHSSATGSGS